MRSLFFSLCLSLFASVIFAQNPDCNNINMTPGNGAITISGVSGAPIVGVQVFNSSWTSVFNQTYTNPSGNIVVSPLLVGQYFVNVRFYTSSWAVICEKGNYVTVSTQEPPPSDSCLPTFQKTYGTAAGEDYGVSIVKASDGAYVIAGKSAVSGTTNLDAQLLKLDVRGNIIWSKTYGGGLDDQFFDLVQTTDGGFVAAGITKSAGNASGDAWLVKTDATGNVQWQKRYTDNATNAFVYGLTQTSDGGFAFVGDFPQTPGTGDVMVLKTDGTGNIQWQKKLGSSSSDEGIGIIEDNHGGAGLVITGYNYSITSYDADLAKFDLTTGTILWTKTYDFDNRTNRIGKIWKVADGFIIEGVNHDGFESANAIHSILKTDFNGNLISIREFKAPNCINGHTTLLADGGFLISDGEDLNDANTDVHFIRTDAAGNILWTKKYPRADLQWVNGIINDGNYAIATGYSKSGSYNDIMVLKLDLGGKLGSCSAVNETGLSRVPTSTSMSAGWVSLGNLNLAANATSFSPVSNNLLTNTFCIDSCAVPPPTISISNVTVNENAGNAVLQVCLSAASTQQVTVQYATANGSATAGSDYTASSGTATIPAGQTCTTISVPIINDAIAESTESFTVTLSTPTNATIGTGTGTVTINDDDQSQYNCNNITITPGNNLMTIAGLTAPVVTVQVFNSSWASVFNQSYNAPGTVNVPIPAGAYHVKVTFYTNNWSFICDKNQDVTVVNQCPSGTICISNLCPSQEVDLNAAYSISNLPPGTVVSWHTATPATDANRMTAAQAMHVTTSGTYYAAINISGSNCYSNTIPVNVTIIQCSGSSAITGLELKSAGEMPSGKIMVYPNPFTHSVHIVIQSEKTEKATLVLTDVMGRQLKAQPVQLMHGGNQFSFEGLDQFPSGSYFLKVASSGGIQTFKILRQQ